MRNICKRRITKSLNKTKEAASKFYLDKKGDDSKIQFIGSIENLLSQIEDHGLTDELNQPVLESLEIIFSSLSSFLSELHDKSRRDYDRFMDALPEEI